MDRAGVRALMIVVNGLFLVLLSTPVNASATPPNKAGKSTTDPGYVEQSFFKERLKFLYVIDHFIAGGDAAYVQVKDLTNGQFAIDFAESEFLHPEAGLKRQHVAPEYQGFYVTIPTDTRTGNYPYRVKFDCRRPSVTCETAIFSVPVKNDNDQLLQVKLGTGPFYIPVVAESYDFPIELKARKPIYGVRLESGNHLAVGIRSFQLRESGDAANSVIKQTIDKITPGRPFHGFVRVNRTDRTAQTWNYLVSDWRGNPTEVPLTFTYSDTDERKWRLQSAPVKFDYKLPPWGVLLYYAVLLGLATLAGALGRLVAGAAVGTLHNEARTWGYSLLLAGALCVLGLVLRARIEPIGLFQLDLSNLRGILVIGVVAGLVPELIRGRLQTLLPGRQAPEVSTIAVSGRERVMRTNGRIPPPATTAGGERGERNPSSSRPSVDNARLAG